MISNDEAYLLGILYGKGAIIQVNENEVVLHFRIKFRRPTDQSVRSDNIHTVVDTRSFVESLKSKLTNDFSMIINLLKRTWNINSTINLPNSYSLEDWGMKEITVISEVLSKKHERLCDIFQVDELDNNTLLRFPFHLNMENKPAVSLSFVQGICDSCSLVPNEASSGYGGEGNTRIQLEPSQERWEIPIGLCKIFQQGLGIPVNNINWGHPQIRNKWRGQNHQFRVSLKNIPTTIELYRLEYKREEYKNLYERRGVKYEAGELCPLSKAVKEGDKYILNKSNDEDLNSNLLDERLRGIDINVTRKKSLMICKLLGCDQCKNYFEIEVENNISKENMKLYYKGKKDLNCLDIVAEDEEMYNKKGE